MFTFLHINVYYVYVLDQKCFSSVTRYRVIATGVKEQGEAKITYLMSMLECPFVFRL